MVVPGVLVVVAATAVPQRAQNLAPGLSDAPQPKQSISARAKPHSEQNRPVPIVLQRGQVLEAGADVSGGGVSDFMMRGKIL